MSGWRLRFGVGAGAVGVVADVSLSVGWLSVDCGVGGLCTGGLGLRSRWKLRTNGETERCSRGNATPRVCARERVEPGGFYLLEHGEPSLVVRKSREELTFLNWACSLGYRRIMGKVKSKVILRPSTISLHSSSL